MVWNEQGGQQYAAEGNIKGHVFDDRDLDVNGYVMGVPNLPGTLGVNVSRNGGKCNQNFGGLIPTDPIGKYAFTANWGEHFCVGGPISFYQNKGPVLGNFFFDSGYDSHAAVDPNTGALDPGFPWPFYTEQVSHWDDCQSFLKYKDKNEVLRCTQGDPSHQIDTGWYFDTSAGRCTAGGNSYTANTNVWHFSSDGHAHLCNEGLFAAYGPADRQCQNGGDWNRFYHEDGNPQFVGQAYLSCHQWADSNGGWHRTVYAWMVDRVDYPPYGWDVPQPFAQGGDPRFTDGDIGYDFHYKSHKAISGQVINTTTGQGYSEAINWGCPTNVGQGDPFNGQVFSDGNGYFSINGPGSILRHEGFCLRDTPLTRNPAGEPLDGPTIATPTDESGVYKYQMPGIDCTDSSNWNYTGDRFNNESLGSQFNEGQWCYRDTRQLTYDNPLDDNYTFKYTQPLFGNPGAIRKNVDSISGSKTCSGNCDNQSVQPGDTIKYSMYVDNPGDTTWGGVVEDLIPLNIDPSSVHVESIVFTYDGITASTTLDPLCAGINQAGYNCGIYTNGFNQAQEQNSQAQTPGVIRLWLGNYPGHSHLHMVWSGKVRQKDQIGSFPSDYRFCNGSNWSNRGVFQPSAGSQGTCQDYSSSGQEGVTNYVRVGYHYTADQNYNGNWSGWRYLSNITHNPIPGAVECVGKNASGLEWDGDQNGDVIQSGVLPGEDPNCPHDIPIDSLGNIDSTAHLVYQTGERAHFLMNSFLDPKQNGPIEYTLFDQGSGRPLDIGVDWDAPVQSGPAGSAYSYPNRTAAWSKVNTALHYSLGDSFDLGVLFNGNRPITDPGNPNGYVTNCSAAQWTDYSTLGAHPTRAVGSNCLQIKHVNLGGPAITAENGNSLAGAAISSGNTCTPDTAATVDSNNNVLAPSKVNLGSQSRYYSLASDTNNFVSAIDAQRAAYTNVCRPDLGVNQTNVPHFPGGPLPGDYNPATHVFSPSPGHQNQYNGYVVDINDPNVTLPSTTIHGRWTLHVPSKLSITGDIKYSGGNDSFGVIAGNNGVTSKGNIEIDPNVTELNGAYFADGYVNTCARNGATLDKGLDALTCKNRLTVNGSMEGIQIRFNRTYMKLDANGVSTPPTMSDPSTIAEFVQFMGQFYTLTPPGFSTLSNLYNPPSFTELRPRF